MKYSDKTLFLNKYFCELKHSTYDDIYRENA